MAPDCSATAVREPLVEMANPWKRPEATFAAPMPTISWSGSTSSPRRAAKLVAVAIVSVRETRVMPTAAMSSGTTSSVLVHGMLGDGTPCGSAPTVTTPSAAASPSAAHTAVAPTTATRIAGTFLVMRGRTSSTSSTPTPISSVVVLVSSRWSKNWRSSSMKPSASVEKPNSLGADRR